MLRPALPDDRAADPVFLADVIDGLGRPRKTLPCKYFYDAQGSALFDAICDLPEYYPTRTEMALLKRHAGEVAARVGPDATLVELGSGSCVKARLLLDALERPAAYVPVDISRDHLLRAAACLAADYPELRVVPVCADYVQDLPVPAGLDGARTLAFFPGSTIGNFNPNEAVAFLARLAARLGHGAWLLIGVDLKKDRAVLEAAYNDAQGVTAAFNLNLLARINRELGGTFDLARFAHRAFYNADQGRIEMHLVSRGEQIVHVAGRPFRFAAGETIHTEVSHKYAVTEFRNLAARAGWRGAAVWCDGDRLFSVHLLRNDDPGR